MGNSIDADILSKRATNGMIPIQDYKNKQQKPTIQTPVDEFESFFGFGLSLEAKIRDLVNESPLTDENRKSIIKTLIERENELDVKIDSEIGSLIQNNGQTLLPQDLGRGCTKSYCQQFLREPIGDERPCIKGPTGCVSAIMLQITPYLVINPRQPKPVVLREFYTPNEMDDYWKSGRKWPQVGRMCLLCSRFRTTRGFYAYTSRSQSIPQTQRAICQIQNHWNLIENAPGGYYSSEMIQFSENGSTNWCTTSFPIVAFVGSSYRLGTMKLKKTEYGSGSEFISCEYATRKEQSHGRNKKNDSDIFGIIGGFPNNTCSDNNNDDSGNWNSSSKSTGKLSTMHDGKNNISSKNTPNETKNGGYINKDSLDTTAITNGLLNSSLSYYDDMESIYTVRCYIESEQGFH